MIELSLDLGLVYAPKSMSEFLGEVSKIGDGFRKLLMIDDFVKRLEDEMTKIDAFKRELPLCMLLLKDAIGRLKEERMRCKVLNNGSGSEEVLTLKKHVEEDEISNKKNWMSSVQLWSTDISYGHEKQEKIPELNLMSEEDDRSVSENPNHLCSNTNRVRVGAFVPFKGQSEMKQSEAITGLSLMSPISELVSCNSGLKSNSGSRFGSLSENQNQMKVHGKPQQQQQQQALNSRKHRRCWSPDLHRRFVEALQHLGGSKVATPKQIRELMQVDGLTNDEVKSHLQKYRLHIRKLPAANASGLCMAQDQCSDRMKVASISQSGSPQGPLLAGGSGKGTSSTGGNNGMEAEEEEKSDGQSWRGGVLKSQD